MKKTLLTTSLLVTFILTIIGCNPKSSAVSPDTTVPDETIPQFVGTWVFVLAPIPTLSLNDTFSLSLTIKQNNTYNINALQRSDKTLFSSDGTWHSTVDSLTLIGDSCMALDTLSNELTAIPDSTCATPITLPHPQSNSLWRIKTANFMVALSSLPVQKNMISQLPLLIQTINLTRKE